MPMTSTDFTFGIYPFGVVGMAVGVARAPDDLRRLPAILDALRGGRKLLLRTYLPFAGEESVPAAMAMLQLCAVSGAPWDVVLSFRIDSDDLTGWLRFIRRVVTQFGKSLDTLQITGEPNLRGMPDAGDGSRPHVRRALRDGILAAKSAARDCAAPVSIGFNAVPTFDPADDFWLAIAGFGEAFVESLDYVGLDFYPDVFGGRIPPRNSPRRLNRSSGNSETATSPPEESRRAFPCASARTAGTRGSVVLMMIRPGRWSRSSAPRMASALN